MAIEIRPAQPQEMDQFGLMGSYSYGGAFGDGPNNIVTAANRPEWTLCAFDGSVMATSFTAFPFTIRANGNAMAFAGVSGVGTHPEYRRRPTDLSSFLPWQMTAERRAELTQPAPATWTPLTSEAQELGEPEAVDTS